MWPYSWTHVGTPSHLGHMDRVAATMPSQAHAGAAQEAPNIGQWEGQDVPLLRPSSCTVKGGIPSSRRYLPTYLSLSSAFIGTQPRPQNTAGATGAPAPSWPDPASPRQEHAAKRAARRYQPTPQHRLDSASAPPQGAPARDRSNPAPSSERRSTQHHRTAATQTDAGAGPEKHPGAKNPQPTASPRLTRNQALRNPTLAHGQHHPLSPPRADPEPCPHRGSPAQPKAPVPPVSPPALGPTLTLAPARTTNPLARARTRMQRHRLQPTVPQPLGPTLAQTLGGARHQATMAGSTDVPPQTGRRESPTPRAARHGDHVTRRLIRRHGPWA